MWDDEADKPSRVDVFASTKASPETLARYLTASLASGPFGARLAEDPTEEAQVTFHFWTSGEDALTLADGLVKAGLLSIAPTEFGARDAVVKRATTALAALETALAKVRTHYEILSVPLEPLGESLEVANLDKVDIDRSVGLRLSLGGNFQLPLIPCVRTRRDGAGRCPTISVLQPARSNTRRCRDLRRTGKS